MKRRRLAKGISKAGLAERAGLHQTYIGLLEKPVALLHDRLARINGSASPVWFATGALPGENLFAPTNRLGNFPPESK